MKEQHAEAVDVTLHGRGPPARTPRERGTAACRPAVGSPAPRPSSSPVPKSISTTRPPVLAHDVLRLDVAMHEAGAVHGRQRAAQIEADERRLLALRTRRAPRSTASSVRPRTNSIHRPTRPSMRSAP